jgi:3-methyladenine DNA glycosylase AlkD
MAVLKAATMLCFTRCSKVRLPFNENFATFFTFMTRFLRLTINNWDLVDVSTPAILGHHLEHRDREVLYDLAASDNLWERRMAILATFHFIRAGSYIDTIRLAEIMLDDTHDLLHKAVGWMLWEVGKRDLDLLIDFLDRYYQSMARTMLRYAIERFPEDLRQAYLQGTR